MFVLKIWHVMLQIYDKQEYYRISKAMCVKNTIWISNKMDYEVEPHVPRWIESGKECIKVEPLWIICDPD